MMQKRKSYLIFALAACMVLGSAFTAQAADTKIDKVRLTFSYDREPKSGEEIGNIHVKTDSNEFRVDYAEYTNDVDTWSAVSYTHLDVYKRQAAAQPVRPAS